MREKRAQIFLTTGSYSLNYREKKDDATSRSELDAVPLPSALQTDIYGGSRKLTQTALPPAGHQGAVCSRCGTFFQGRGKVTRRLYEAGFCVCVCLSMDRARFTAQRRRREEALKSYSARIFAGNRSYTC